MNIGIITFNRLFNFGSALQTYALNKYLNTAGYHTITIDYIQKEQEKSFAYYEKNKNILSICRNIQRFIYKNQAMTSRSRFRSFAEKYIPKTVPLSYSELKGAGKKFDIIICGSDQIWNPRYKGFDESYLLEFVSKQTKKFAYAASIGISDVNAHEKSIFQKHLNTFDFISVREIEAKRLLEPVITKPIHVVCDPVFLIDKSNWEKIAGNQPIIEKPYALYYFIGNVTGMRNLGEKIKKQIKMPVVVVRMNLRDLLHMYKKYYEVGPTEFLNLLYHAKYIYTNSFHAVCFSLIFHKPFWVSMETNLGVASQCRIENLLTKVQLEHRIITHNTAQKDFLEDVDFSNSDVVLKKWIYESKTILKEALHGGMNYDLSQE